MPGQAGAAHSRRQKTTRWYDSSANNEPLAERVSAFISLAKFAWREWHLIVPASVCLLFSAAATLYVQKLLGKYMSDLVVSGVAESTEIANEAMASHESEDTDYSSVINLLLLICLKATCDGLHAILMTKAGERVTARVRGDLFTATMHAGMAKFDSIQTGELTATLDQRTGDIRKIATEHLPKLVQGVIGLVCTVVSMAMLSLELTCTAVCVGSLIAFSSASWKKFVNKMEDEAQKVERNASSVAQEAIISVRTVKSFGQEKLFTTKYRRLLKEGSDLSVQAKTWRAIWKAQVLFFSSFGVAYALIRGADMVRRMELEQGELLSFILFCLSVGQAVSDITIEQNRLLLASNRSKQAIEELDEWEAAASKSNTADAAERATLTKIGAISLRNVSFEYPTELGKSVLKNVNLMLQPGTVTAIVGRSGSGKSTLISLLLRLYTPSNGVIFMGNTPMNDIPKGFLCSKIAVVEQRPILFNKSFLDNIIFGWEPSGGWPSDEAKRRAVRQAAEQAQADEFIRKKGDYDSIIIERGQNLSGGEQQRIAIARALLRNPEVILLDEATSSLDTESETQVQEALTKSLLGRTAVIVAHRMHTIRKADLIVVMDDGEVIETGSHDTLTMNPNSAYSALLAASDADDNLAHRRSSSDSRDAGARFRRRRIASAPEADLDDAFSLEGT